MNVDEPEDALAIAYHEAGHTVAICKVYGRRSVERVWISPTKEPLGGCKPHDRISPIGLPEFLDVPWAGTVYPLPSGAYAELICAAAGIAAQRLLEEVRSRGSRPLAEELVIIEQGCGDGERAARVLTEYGISQPTVFRTVFVPKALELLRKRSAVVEKVAAALVTDREIDGARVDKIVFGGGG